MVSNARLDLPEPDSPVITTSLSRGISREMFFRLCTRAPFTAIVVRAPPLNDDDDDDDGGDGRRRSAAMAFRSLRHVEERQLLDHRVAPLGELERHAGLPEQAPVGQVLAGGGHALDAVVP